ncbi:MAG: adenosylmethionine--8-amino-7-oxononanoate transaminase [Deltaproteobacteria bacterium]
MPGNAKKLKTLDRRYLWHPFTQMKEWLASSPLVIERGRGNYLIDTEGRRYLDGVSSMWANLHGHRKKEIDRAIKTQLDKIAHSTLLGLSNVPSIELARGLVRIAPKGLKRVFFSDNGSTAVEIALKMSFQYWARRKGGLRRKKFVSFTNAYHGDTLGAMGVGEIDVFVSRYRPLLFKTFRSPYPYCYRCATKKTYPACSIACLERLEGILKKHGEEIAACIIEPVFEGASGMVVAPKGFLKGVRDITKKYGVLLIADEVAAGFGRTGRMFACDTEGVAPDLLCLAKGLTAGYMPLAATLATEDIFNAFLGDFNEHKAFYHGHTYTGNPLGCAAALASLQVFEKEQVLKNLKPKIRLLKTLLEKFRELKHAGDIRQTGLVAAVEVVRDKGSKARFNPALRIGHRVAMEARTHGLIIRPLGDTIVIMPPLSITEKEMRTIVDVVFRCIETITGRK